MSDVPHAEAYGSGEPGLEGDCELDAACSADVETAPPPRPTRSPAATAALTCKSHAAGCCVDLEKHVPVITIPKTRSSHSVKE